MDLGILFISIFLIASEIYVCAAGMFYEEITEAVGHTINGESIQQSALIHKSFHLCSMKESCNYIIKDTTRGNFILYDSEDQIPQNKFGLRIWKKLYHGPLKDCKDVYNRGYRSDGVFSIPVPVIGLSQVRCDVTTPPGGWIVFQRRVDGAVGFNRNWADYKKGFGDLSGNFWLGLEKLHQLAAPGRGASLRVDLTHNGFPGEIRHAEYSLFEISGETDGYRLRVDGYSGNAGNSLSFHDKTRFSTKDRDQDTSDQNCASTVGAGWWFTHCFSCNLNGIFPPNSIEDQTYMSWYHLNNDYGRIIFSEMKIKF